jgi:DNA-binding response OmpR family regulator
MSTTQRHILLIEDDPAVAQSLTEGLASHGYQVAWRSSGGEGLRFAREHTPHLMILDVKLPDVSGFDACRQMRQLGLTQPILMLTVRNEEVDKILGLEMGADDYLTKPYSLRELLSRVRALLRRAYGELAVTDVNLLYAGDLVIDRGRGQVWRGKQVINLTPVEFRLLVFLAQHPHQALSRQQILQAVWGYEPTVDTDNTINAHIRRLREKIELDPSHPTLILTVMGIGYRLAGG